jgi:hypothetical protein
MLFSVLRSFTLSRQLGCGPLHVHRIQACPLKTTADAGGIILFQQSGEK